LKRNVVVFAAMVVVVAGLLTFALLRMQRSGGRPGTDAVAPGRTAPDFTLTDLQGNTVQLSQLRGKTVVLNFWATWCPPCKDEIPWFIQMQKQYGAQGLQVVGVSMDDGDPKDVVKFASKIGINYPVLMGEDKVAREYGGIDYLPTTFYINRNGVVTDRVFGEPARGEIERDVQRAIASPAKPIS
jgi:peroxiredoxin